MFCFSFLFSLPLLLTFVFCCWWDVRSIAAVVFFFINFELKFTWSKLMVINECCIFNGNKKNIKLMILIFIRYLFTIIIIQFTLLDLLCFVRKTRAPIFHTKRNKNHNINKIRSKFYQLNTLPPIDVYLIMNHFNRINLIRMIDHNIYTLHTEYLMYSVAGSLILMIFLIPANHASWKKNTSCGRSIYKFILSSVSMYRTQFHFLVTTFLFSCI